MNSQGEAVCRVAEGAEGGASGDGVPVGGSYASLMGKIESREAVVGVIGLGYVGLPLIATFHSAGFRAIGFDTSQTKVDLLTSGVSYLDHLKNSKELFKSLADSPTFDATTDMGRLSECDAILICVPTPLGEHFEPDLSFVKRCGEVISGSLREGQLVVLESTTYPGTTREVLLPMMEATGRSISLDYFLAFSPEREDPGNANHDMYSIPKLVGGIDPSSGHLAVALYKAAFKSVLGVSRSEIAEAAKVVENVYRAVNIALVNELKIVLAKMDVDIWEVGSPTPLNSTPPLRHVTQPFHSPHPSLMRYPALCRSWTPLRPSLLGSNGSILGPAGAGIASLLTPSTSRGRPRQSTCTPSSSTTRARSTSTCPRPSPAPSLDPQSLPQTQH